MLDRDVLYSNGFSHPTNESVSMKEDERAERHRTLWRIANDLRGSVDGWNLKSSVLGMLFQDALNQCILYESRRCWTGWRRFSSGMSALGEH